MSRFLFVVDAPDDTLGGMSRHFRFMGREIERKGHRVDYIFVDQMPPPLLPRLRGFSLDISRRACTAVFRHIRTHGRPDLIYWGINSAFPFSTINKWRVSPIPIVGMTFGVEERWWPIVEADAGQRGAPLTPAYQLATRKIRVAALKRATLDVQRMVCVSSDDSDYLVHQYGLDKSRVAVVPVGVEPRFFDAASPDRTGTRVLFVGTWLWRKGIRYLVDAMQDVWRRHPECELTIVTFPPFELVREWWPPEIRDRIRVVSASTDEQLAREYGTHDVFVLPSLFEGMPMSLAEAMAAGMAVVTTSTCGMKDLVRAGEDGELVPTHDAPALAAAVNGLLDDPQRQRVLGARAAARIRDYTWDRIADRFLDVFAGVMTAPEPAPVSDQDSVRLAGR